MEGGTDIRIGGLGLRSKPAVEAALRSLVQLHPAALLFEEVETAFSGTNSELEPAHLDDELGASEHLRIPVEPVQREVVQVLSYKGGIQDMTWCFATSSLPRRAGLVTARFEALGTMYPWSQGRSRNREGTVTTGSVIR